MVEMSLSPVLQCHHQLRTMSTWHGEVDIEKDGDEVVEIKETTEMLGEVEMFEVGERGGRSRVEFWSRGGCSQSCGEVREDPDN